MSRHTFAVAFFLSFCVVLPAARPNAEASTAPEPLPVRLVVQLGHANAVASVAFSPDGKQVLTGSWDGTARLWDAAGGKEIRAFRGHTSRVNSVAFSPDGKQVLTGSDDKTARLWDAASGKEIRAFLGHTGSVNSAAFAPDGKQVLTGGSDKTARLWDAASGTEIRAFRGHGSWVKSVAFSPDGKQVLTGSFDKTARLWDAASGKEIRSFRGHTSYVYSVAFSPDGKQVLTGSEDETARLWDAASGKEIRTFHTGPVCSAAFSPDGRQVLAGSVNGTARLWDAASGKEIRTFHTDPIYSVAFSPDGKQVLAGGFDQAVRLWDAASGKEIRTFRGHAGDVYSVAFSPDGKQVLAGGFDQAVRLWDAASGKEIHRFRGHAGGVWSVAFSPDGKQVLTGSWDKAARLWDAASGKEIRAFLGHIGAVLSVAFSPDGKQVLTGGSDKTARLWDAASGKEIRTFRGHTDSVRSVAVSPGGKQVLTGSHDNTARLWDVASGKEIRTFRGHTDWVRSVAVSPDGKQVLTGSEDETARLWDAASGKEIRTFHTDHVYSVAFSPDGKQVLAGGFDQAVRLWDAASGTEIRTFRGDAGSVKLVAFSPDGKRLLTAHAEGRTILWDAASGVELCSLVSFADGDWAVVDPQGRFDAANGGNVEGLHWVIGNEPIDLFQLKERYYEPGLLAKKMGFNHEPLRNVARLDNPKLYPGIELRPPTPGDPQLHVELSNRGGGIGRVVVRINGKELTADARGPGHDPDARALTLEVPLPPDQPLLTPGQPNRIVVEAYNAEGYLHSRGLELNYEPPAARPPEKPHLWIVVSGVSSYRGPSLELRFAAKDAEDFARAAEIGARRLFDRDRVHLALLTSSQADPKRRPTCDNLRAAFADIRAAGAKSTDILVVYLAGHGVNYGGQDGDFYYLTADAQSADLSDPAVREGAALSGQQITELINGIPALKQVLVLDTCASGRLIEKLTEKRDIPTSQIRALERLKDRTGMHVLAGCAADSVSYEATRYGQGVLTYSLLLGMRGAALREDQFVDVATLFGFATDKVPKLAGDIGGIQRPLLAVPKGGASFDIGQLSGEDRQQIPLQPARPLVLRSTFQDEETFDDALGLSKRVDELLRGVSVRGSAGAVVFVDARELPEGYHLNGLYKTEGGQATLRARLFRGRERAAEFTLAAERPDELAERVVEAVEKWFRNGGAR